MSFIQSLFLLQLGNFSSGLGGVNTDLTSQGSGADVPGASGDTPGVVSSCLSPGPGVSGGIPRVVSSWLSPGPEVSGDIPGVVSPWLSPGPFWQLMDVTALVTLSQQPQDCFTWNLNCSFLC